MLKLVEVFQQSSQTYRRYMFEISKQRVKAMICGDSDFVLLAVCVFSIVVYEITMKKRKKD